MSTTPTQAPAQSEDVMQRFQVLLSDYLDAKHRDDMCEGKLSEIANERYASYDALRDFVSALARDKQRVDHVEKHGQCVAYSKGYHGSSDSWCYQDKQRAFRDADTWRAAMDEVLKQEGTK